MQRLAATARVPAVSVASLLLHYVHAVHGFASPEAALIEAGDPTKAFPFFDCWDDDDTPHDVWSDLYDFALSLEALGERGDRTARSLHAVGAKHLPSLLGYRASGDEVRLATTCPYSLVPLHLAQWAACWLATAGVGGGCNSLRVSLVEALSPPATPATLLNSRWMRPYCGLVDFFRPLVHEEPLASDVDPLGIVRSYYDCRNLPEGQAPSGVDWRSFLEAITEGQSGGAFVNDWISKTMRFAFAPNRLVNIQKNINECVMGYLTIILEKIHVAQAARTEEYEKLMAGFVATLMSFESALDARLRQDGVRTDAMSVLMSTSWPIMNLLCATARNAQGDTEKGRHGYQYKPYALDFHRRELLWPEAERARLTETRGLPRGAHLERLHGKTLAEGVSDTFALVMRGLRDVLMAWEAGAPGVAGTKLALFTMVWGRRLSGYLRHVLQRAAAFKLDRRYFIFCLDEEALSACHDAHPAPQLCVPGLIKTIYNKYTMLAVIIQMGFDALYLDFDTMLLADPLPALLAGAEDAEVIVSRDFGSACLNTGVIYMKAHPDTAELLVSLLVWLWHHPYEFSQKAFSAFLQNENATDNKLFPLPLKKVPRWTVFDPLNGFVTNLVYNLGIEGWTGSLDGIVVFHFLDGTGGVDPERAVRGAYFNFYDLFYNNPRIDLSDLSRPLWEQDPDIRSALLSSRVEAPPAVLVPCALMDKPTA